MFGFILRNKRVWIVDYFTHFEICSSAWEAYKLVVYEIVKRNLSSYKSHYWWYNSLESEYLAKAKKSYRHRLKRYDIDSVVRVYTKRIV